MRDAFGPFCLRGCAAAATPRTPSFKLLLVGDGGVGKTSYARSFCGMLDGRYDVRHNEATGAAIYPAKIHTNHGPVLFNIWEGDGQEYFGGLRDALYIKGECAIIMFDVMNLRSYKSVKMWYKDVVRACGEIPMVLVGNKVDVPQRKVLPSQITSLRRRLPLQYYDIAVKSNVKTSEPLLWLAKTLTGIADMRRPRAAAK